MNETKTARNGVEQRYFLTELIGARAYLQGKKIGKLTDMIVVDQGKLAEVTHFEISRPFGDPPLLVPQLQARSLGLERSPSTSIVRNHTCGGWQPEKSR